MPFGLSYLDRVQVATTTIGTGTVTLGSASTGLQSWAAAGAVNNGWYPYLILDSGNAWELGYGQYSSSGPTLTRNVESSSNSNALLNLSGAATVACAGSVGSNADSVVPIQGYSVPGLATWTWANQSTAAFNQAIVPGPTLLTAPSASNQNRCLFIGAPSTPYKIKGEFSFLCTSGGTGGLGPGFYDGIKALQMGYSLGSGNLGFFASRFTTLSSAGATQASLVSVVTSQVGSVWLQSRNDGSHLYLDWGLSETDLINLWTENVGTFITPTDLALLWGQASGSAAGFAGWVQNLSISPNANLNGP